MPLRDHSRPPLSDQASWEEFHGQWPATMVQHLHRVLPEGYVAGPKVHLGTMIKVEVATYEKDDPGTSRPTPVTDGGVATAVWAPPRPTLRVDTDLSDYDEYEVRIYDARRGRQLVAAIELVSPANKDRPEHRNAFLGKCAAMLQNGIAVSIVDLVTTRQSNLYAELMHFLGQEDAMLGVETPATYAAACRCLHREKRGRLEAWSYPLRPGQPLPTLPLWLAESRVVPLDLEISYEQACRDLWIP